MWLWVFDDCAVVFLEENLTSGGGVCLEIREVCAEHWEVVVAGISFADSSFGMLCALYGHVFGLDL
jgi:hypothetical protein